MKFQRNSFLSIFAVFVVFFFLFVAMEEVFSKPPQERRIEIEPGAPEDWKDTLVPKINQMHKDLATYFSKGKFVDMYNRLGSKAVIVYAGTTYSGKDIISFWQTQRDIHDKVKFTLWRGLIYRDEEQLSGRNYIGKSHEIFWFEFNPDGDEGEGSNRRLHRDTCEWEDGGN